MAKRWTAEDDLTLLDYHGGVPSPTLGDDLGRSAASVDARVRFLKASGAWRLYAEAQAMRIEAEIAAGLCRSDEQQMIWEDRLAFYGEVSGRKAAA